MRGAGVTVQIFGGQNTGSAEPWYTVASKSTETTFKSLFKPYCGAPLDPSNAMRCNDYANVGTRGPTFIVATRPYQSFDTRKV